MMLKSLFLLIMVNGNLMVYMFLKSCYTYYTVQTYNGSSLDPYSKLKFIDSDASQVIVLANEAHASDA